MDQELWLPATPESAPTAREVVRELARELELDQEITWDLLLATTEAVANAIEHGRPCDPRGILLRLEARSDGIGVEVSDCGRFPSSGRSPKPHDQGGRGMPIIAAVMDHLEVRPCRGLTRVRFEKRLAAAA